MNKCPIKYNEEKNPLVAEDQYNFPFKCNFIAFKTDEWLFQKIHLILPLVKRTCLNFIYLQENFDVHYAMYTSKPCLTCRHQSDSGGMKSPKTLTFPPFIYSFLYHSKKASFNSPSDMPQYISAIVTQSKQVMWN